MSDSSDSTSSDERYINYMVPRVLQRQQERRRQQQQKQQAPPSSSRNKRKEINRDRVDHASKLERDYFVPGATYEDKFRRRY